MRHRSWFAVSVSILAACLGGEPTNPEAGAPPSFAISDAVHSGGNRGFFWLPPMVPNPSGNPDWNENGLDSDLSPVVEICALALAAAAPENDVQAGTPCRGSSDPNFYLVTSGAGPLPPVTLVDGHYQVNWQVPNDASNAYYRIRVVVGTIELGIADVHSANSGRDLKNVNTGEFIPRVDGSTLPIHFRIQTGIVGAVTVSPETAEIPVGSAQAFTATVTDLHGVVLGGATPVWSSAAEDVAEVDPSGSATGLTPGVAVIIATVAGVSGSGSLTVIPAGPTGLVAVVSNRFTTDGTADLVVMNADGSDPRTLAPSGPHLFEEGPDISPDRSTVIYSRSYSIFSVDIATGVQTFLNSIGAFSRFPKWSPNGQKIAFYSLVEVSTGADLFIMNADGTGITRITNTPGDDFQPTWSPDGQRLAFLSNRAGGINQLWVRDLGTGVDRQVTFDSGNREGPRWAPSGSLVTYMNGASIWVVDVDNGTPPTQLTSGARDGDPSWSPNGQQIVFHSNRASAQNQIWIMDANGANLQLFIPSMGFHDVSPSWR